jgi:hypothetical protein
MLDQSGTLRPFRERLGPPPAEQFLVPGGVHQIRQTRRLRSCHPPPEVRYTIVAAAPVIQLRVGALIGLLYEPVGEHAFDRPIQRPRPEPYLAPRLPLDLLYDAVPVPLLLRERQQYVQNGRRQR